jgi:hypothetical protein
VALIGNVTGLNLLISMRKDLCPTSSWGTHQGAELSLFLSV